MYGGSGGEESSALYDPNGKDDDFFGEFMQGQSMAKSTSGDLIPEMNSPVARRKGAGMGSMTSRAKAKTTKEHDDWDDWKDF